MSLGTSPVERDQRERGIVVDNAFRPGKGSKPRPFAVSYDEFSRRMASIFGWGRKSRRKGGRKTGRTRRPATLPPTP